MCGIVYGLDLKHRPINHRILEQFEKQKSRGRLGFGLYDVNYGNIVKSQKEEKLLKWLKKYPSTEILFHHRYPTSTANTKSACHPFSTKDFFKTNYVLVHNGQITNSKELKVEHEKLGIKYQSIQPDGRFNDSEALAWDVSLYLEGKQDELKAKGTIAFICVAESKDDKKLYFARNTNPLNMSFKKKVLLLSSEGRGQAILPDRLYSLDYATKKVTNTVLTIPKGYVYKAPTTPTYSGWGGYEHGMTDDEQDWAQWAKDQSDKYSKDLEEQEEINNILEARVIELLNEQPETLLNYELSYSEDHELRTKDIKNIFRMYINSTDTGYVVDAFTTVDRDIKWLEEAQGLYWLENNENDPDLEYDLEIRKIVKNMLFKDNNWSNTEEPHPLFKEKPKLLPVVQTPTLQDVHTMSVSEIIQLKLDERKAKNESK